MPTETTETETTETETSLAPFNELRAQIEAKKAENAALTFDYADPKGAKAARSHIYELRKGKGEVERVHKRLKAGALAFGKKVDALKRELTGEIESMIAVHETPLKEIEERETARKQRHEENLLKLQMPQEIITDSKACQGVIESIEAIDVTEGWDEYAGQAKELKANTLTALKQRYVALRKQEADAVELEKLRKQAAEREEADRKKAAEEAAKAREEEIRKQAEAEAAAKAKAAQEAAIRKEREEAEAKAAEERRKAEEAIKAEQEKARQAEQRLERERQAAKEAEQRREREAKEKAEAEAKRKADADHRQKVLREAADAIAHHGDLEYGAAASIAADIADGKIPHVTMQF